jgi:hypothetical protein
MSGADTACVVPLSNMMRYCRDDMGSSGMSITVPARLRPEDGLVSRTLVLGGKAH